MKHRVDWQLVRDVPGQPVGQILGYVTLENVIDRLSRNVCIQLPTYTARQKNKGLKYIAAVDI